MPMSSVLIFLILFGSFGCTGQSQRENVVARVGNQVLTLEEIDVLTSSRNDSPVSAEAKREFIRQWVDTQVLYREALRENLHKDKKFRRAINQMKKELLVAELMERRIGSEMAIANWEIEKYYEDHRSEFVLTKPLVRARHILVNSIEKASQVRNRLVQGEAFDALVTETSIDTATHETGGDLGTFFEDDVAPEIASAAFSLQIDEISEPVQTEWGYHIIQVTDMKPEGSLLPFDEVKEEIANKIFNSKQRLAFDRLIKELKENEDIEIHWNLIIADTSANEPF